MNFLVIALTLLWTPAENAEGYRVYKIDAVGAPWELHEDIGPRSPESHGYIEYITADPVLLTLYQVRAYNDAGESAIKHALVGYDPEAPIDLPDWPDATRFGTVGER